MTVLPAELERGGKGEAVRLALVALVAVVAQAWILRLPFQLDDFLLVADPWALFGHVDQLRDDDVPAFMCRIPMWVAWGLVHLVTPEPLSPVPFHVFGLALHACAAVLLARAVMRHAPAPFAALGGVLAGAAFGAMGGAMQAVSWTAAWSSLLYTIFALGALNAALDGRVPGASRRGAAGAGVLLYLAILTKVPGLVAAGVVLVVLVLTAAARRTPAAWRRLGVELAWSAGAIAAGLATRAWYLGTRHLRYEEQVEPGLGELPGIVARGFHALGQALFPWNRDPLFTGDGPLLAVLGLPAPWVAALFAAPVVALAFALAPRARAPLALLVVCLVPAIVPPGVIYAGQPTNVVSREAYLPLAVAAAALGLAVGALALHRRPLGAAAAVAVALLVLDGRRHVARTERLHADELRAVSALLDDLALEATPGERELLTLALVPDGGFAGIPSLGGLLPASRRPPFTAAAHLEIRTFASTRALAEWLAEPSAEADLSARDVVLIGPACDATLQPLGPDPALAGAENRARRLLRRLTPLRPGHPPGGSRELAWDATQHAWRPATPLPAHAVGALELDVASGAPVRGSFTLGPLHVAIDDPGSPGTRLALGLPTDPALRLGPPLERIQWDSTAPPPAASLHARATLPALLPLAPPPDATLPIQAFLAHGPTFTVAPPDPALRRGAFARLELQFELLGRTASVFSDAPLPPTGPISHTPATIHLEPDRATPLPEASPWRLLPEERILPTLTAGDLNGATFRWRLTVLHPGGAPAARTPFQSARFVLP